MTTQVAVKLPEEVVAGVDQLIAEGEFANRSQVVRQALEALLRNAERRRIDAAFAAGFARLPEGDAEMRDAMRLAIEAIEDEPWDRWW
ncbi:MAG: ribbon-helix-helix domain-containing protein [Egibacteraceae bacterium]